MNDPCATCANPPARHLSHRAYLYATNARARRFGTWSWLTLAETIGQMADYLDGRPEHTHLAELATATERAYRAGAALEVAAIHSDEPAERQAFRMAADDWHTIANDLEGAAHAGRLHALEEIHA